MVHSSHPSSEKILPPHVVSSLGRDRRDWVTPSQKTAVGSSLGSPYLVRPGPPLDRLRARKDVLCSGASAQGERGGVAVGSVEPPEDLSSRCSSNRTCRALRFEGFGSMDPDLVRPVQEPGGPCTSQGLSGLDRASFPVAGAPSFRRAYLFEYGFKPNKR
eukprot:scaffold610_cov352-Pavlova_lutheri.AAC.7